MIRRLASWARAEPLLACMCLGLLFLPLSNAVGQVPLYLVSVAGTVSLIRRRERVNKRSLLFLAGFALLILSGFFYAVRVENIADKLNRLLLFPLVLVVPSVLSRDGKPEDRLQVAVLSLLAGTALLGLYDLVRIPLEVSRGARLFDTGHMVPPQMYMTAFFLLLGLGAHAGKPGKPWFFLLLVLFVAGMLLHNKRGVWLAAIMGFGVWVLWSRKWKLLAGGLVIVACAMALPSVRARVMDLRDVVQPQHGGRMVLWNVVAPAVFEQYPWGMGYSGSEHEDFRAVIDEVNAGLPRREHVHLEDRLRHLHNNFLQIRLEMGPHGLLWWTAWMAAALWAAFRPNPAKHDARLLRGGIACAFLALHLNGLVEFNFGASKPLMMFLLLLGMTDALTRTRSADAGRDVPGTGSDNALSGGSP